MIPSESEGHTYAQSAQSSQIMAGGKVNIKANKGDIKVIDSEIAGAKGTALQASKDVILQSLEQHFIEKSTNKSSGASIGASIGASGIGITASVNKGKGYGNGEGISHAHSYIGGGGQTTIISGNDTTLKGAQVYGDGVKVSAQNLNIHSVQDSHKFDGKQDNKGLTIGTDFIDNVLGNVGGNIGKQNIKNDYLSVTEQSGIFAGDDGYQLDIKNHIDLLGGAVVSTQKAEQDGKNSIKAESITANELKNHANYKGDAYDIGASFNVNKEFTSIGGILSMTKKGYGNASVHNNANGTTGSVINTNNVQANSIQSSQSANLINTAITSDNAYEYAGILQDKFDKDAIQKELDVQVQVTKDFGETFGEFKSFLRKLAKKNRDESYNSDEHAEEKLASGEDITETVARNGYYNLVDYSEKEYGINEWLYLADIVGTALSGGSGTAQFLNQLGVQIDFALHNRHQDPRQFFIKVKTVQNEEGKDVVVFDDFRVVASVEEAVGLGLIPKGEGQIIYTQDHGILNSTKDAISNVIYQNQYVDTHGVLLTENPTLSSNGKISFLTDLISVTMDKINLWTNNYAFELNGAQKKDMEIYNFARENNMLVNNHSHSRGTATQGGVADYIVDREKTYLPLDELTMLGAAVNIESVRKNVDKSNWSKRENDGLCKINVKDAFVTHETREGDLISIGFGLNKPNSFTDNSDVKYNPHGGYLTKTGLIYMEQEEPKRAEAFKKKYNVGNRFIVPGRE